MLGGITVGNEHGTLSVCTDRIQFGTRHLGRLPMNFCFLETTSLYLYRSALSWIAVVAVCLEAKPPDPFILPRVTDFTRESRFERYREPSSAARKRGKIRGAEKKGEFPVSNS